MSEPGKARARGRGRAKPQQGPSGPQEHRAPGGPPPGLQKQPTGPPGPPAGIPTQKQASTTSGRATHRGIGRPIDESTAAITQKFGGVSISSSGNGNGSGNGAPVGRGNTRGKRQIYATYIKTRPEALQSKKGTFGQPVMLKANYFLLANQPDYTLNQYRVDFEPSVDLTGERKYLMRTQKEKLGAEYIFDGTVLLIRHRINPDPMEGFCERRDGTQVKITIRLVGDIKKGDYQFTQMFNILTRRCLEALHLKLINRDYFDIKAKVAVPEYNLELWPGYKTTIKQHDQAVLMCAEITHKVMRTDTALDLLKSLTNRGDFRTNFIKAIVGTIVLTDYNDTTYCITDVAWDETPQSTFDKQGTKTSYVAYYKQRYNITVRDVGQPLLVSKSTARRRRAIEQGAVDQPGDHDPTIIKLIPELCRLTGLTDEMRANFNLMRAMATHTRIGPGERIDRLMAMNRRLNGEERVRQEFRNWEMKIAEQLVDVPGRVLPQEQIVLGNNKQVPSGDEADWTRHLRSNPMFVMPQGGLSHWVVMYPSKMGRDVESFVNTLINAANGMKFFMQQPEWTELGDDRTQTYVEKLERVISTLNPQLILVVLANNRSDRYAAIKKKSLVDRAVPTQVLLAKNLSKPKGVMSIATKVAIQINCKIGGAPWSVVMPLGGLMVIGFDVCHDPQSKGKSYSAMVASLNKPMSRYFSAVSHHGVGEELSNDIAVNIVKALQSYRKHNNTLPSHIMIYRDGVGDGQIPTVFNHEVERIRQAVKEVYGQPPKLGFIIVCKKINTRLFFNKNNPRPGTVVDDVVTLPERYDFFIVSQFVNQGTVSPTSYNVIHDTLGLDPDKIQRLTYKLTHCYYNWSGTVRVPAPVQYAHKLAFLVSQALHRPPNPSLEELLFFL